MLLLKSQQRIGWFNFLKGYPSKHWCTHQDRYSQKMFLKKKPGSDNWLAHVFQYIYQHLYSRWKHRNSQLHGNDNYYNKQLLLRRIEGLYALKPSMHTQDHHCFNTPLSDWEQKSLSELQTWLTRFATHIKHCHNQEQSRIQQKTHDIRKWTVKLSQPQKTKLKNIGSKVKQIQSSIKNFSRQTLMLQKRHQI